MNNTTIGCVSDKPNGVEEPQASFIIRAVVMSFILFLALVGNTMVYRGATRMSNRPFTYTLVSNLAVAEIILSVTFPFLFHYTSDPWSWVFGKFMCRLVNPLVVCSTLAITFTLAAIAVYRCLILAQPTTRLSKRSAYLVCFFSWVWGIALSLPASVTRTIIAVEVCGPKTLLLCLERFPNNEMQHNYSIVLFVLQFVLPFLVMVFSYSVVIFKVKKHIRKTKELHGGENATEMPSLANTTGPRGSVETATNTTGSENQRENSTRIQHLESDVLKMIYVIILVFFVCYLPSHIVFISEELEWFSFKDWKYNFILQRYTEILHALPSALHPICYGSMSKLIAVKSGCLCYTCH